MLGLHRIAVDIEPLRVHHDFRNIVAGQLINSLGSQITQIALPYQVYVLTGSPIAIGGLATVQLVALLSFSLMGGAIIDSVERRRLLICTEICLCGVSAALATLAFTGLANLWLLYGLGFIGATLLAIDRPARQSLLPRLVTRERYPAAIAIYQASVKTGTIVGPSLGGVLIATFGLGVAYATDAVSFFAAIASLVSIARLPPVGRLARPGLAAIAEGLAYVRRTPVVLSAFVIDLDAMVFGYPTALFPVLALGFFHVGPAGLGLLASAPAVGAVTALLTSGWLQRIKYQGRAVIICVAIWGVAMSLFAITPFLPFALLMLMLGGWADMISAILRNIIIQLGTPDGLRGRISAVNTMVTVSGPRLGDMESSSVATLLGAQFSAISGGLLCLLGLFFAIRYYPRLLGYEAPGADPQPPAAVPGSAAQIA